MKPTNVTSPLNESGRIAKKRAEVRRAMQAEESADNREAEAHAESAAALAKSNSAKKINKLPPGSGGAAATVKFQDQVPDAHDD